MNLASICGVTQALYQGRICRIDYLSSNSQTTDRRIAPHSIFQVGLHWYIRAYCYSEKEYRTFKLNRINRSIIETGIPSPRCSIKNDSEWNSETPIVLVANPFAKNPESVAFDYGLVNKTVCGRRCQTFMIKNCLRLMFYDLYRVLPGELLEALECSSNDVLVKKQLALQYPLIEHDIPTVL